MSGALANLAPVASKPQPPSAWARGQARLLRDAIGVEDVEWLDILYRMVAPIERRLLNGKRTLRPGGVTELRKMWELMPRHYSISDSFTADKKSIVARVTRLAKADARMQEWDPRYFEPGLIIGRATITLLPRPDYLLENMTSISFHAIARRFDRGAPRTAEAVLENSKMLADIPEDAERVETESGH